MADNTGSSFWNIDNTSSSTPGPAGPPGPPGPPGPGSLPMTPLVEGTAFGETSVGRTLLGFQVDDSSNNVGLWCSSVGLPQGVSNSSSSVTAFFDTDVAGSQLQNGVYVGQAGSMTSTNASNSIILTRASTMDGSADLTQNTLIANMLTLDPSDMITRSVALIGGEFVTHPSTFDQSILIGDVERTGGLASDVILLRTQGGGGTLTMANNSGYIGNGANTYVSAAGDFRVADYQAFHLNTLRPDATPVNVVYYEPADGELTYGPAPVAALPVKQPNTLGGQYGISSLANGSEVNGRGSFANYSAGPVQLTGVTAVGNSLFAVNGPGLSSFTNCIFLGRTHSFNAVQSVTDTLLAANIVTGANISQIVNSNIIVPKAGSLTFTYAGAVTGANIVSSGSVICVSDPLYSTVLASGGSVTPAGSNLVLATNQGAGSISMNGSGNSLVLSAGNSVAYAWPVGVSNSCVLHNGTSIAVPSASNQLCANHLSLRMPNINAAGVADINTTPMAFNSTTGLISPTLSSLLSRVYRAVGTTNAAGQVTFTPGGSINPTTVGYSFQATVRNASTTVAYTCSINAVTATSVTVQVFNSVTVALASPSMVPVGAGIIVHFSMAY